MSGDVSVGLGFPGYALSHALTAASHPDPAVRARAAERAAKWTETISGMVKGDIKVGSRKPTKWPEWVTLDVMWGGFANGSAKAAAVDDDEKNLLANADGEQRNRQELFASYLTDEGLEGLNTLLDSGEYEVRNPEDSALLTVAWLLRAGDADAALDVLEAVTPLASHLRFAPRVAPSSNTPGHVWAMTVSKASTALVERKDPPAIVHQRQNVKDWAPLATKFFELWYHMLRDDDWVAITAENISNTWRFKANLLVQQYDRLPKNSRHAKPSSNVGRLVQATRRILNMEPVDESLSGQVRHALQSMKKKLGPPKSEARLKLQQYHAHVASKAPHSAVAKVFARRLQGLNPHEGVPASTPGIDAAITQEDLKRPRIASKDDPPTEPGAWRKPTDEDKLPAGTELTPFVRHILQRVVAAPAADLIANGALPSAEAYARVLPLEFSGAVAQQWSDEALGRLMARTFVAFRKRRSLLLTDLQHQVRWTELPWVQAAMKHASPPSADTSDNSMTAMLRSAAGTTLNRWPGTILPNPFVSTFNALSQLTPTPVRLLEELAADIFMGRFSPKFSEAVREAASVMGPLYIRYYSIDVVKSSKVKMKDEPQGEMGEELDVLDSAEASGALPDRDEEEAAYNDRIPEGDLVALCRSRRPNVLGNVAGNGSVIEQCQVLSTHNLTTLSALLSAPGAAELHWAALADGAWKQCLTGLRRVAQVLQQVRAESDKEPDSEDWSRAQRRRQRYVLMLRSTKQAAYAWRQAVFFLSQLERSHQQIETRGEHMEQGSGPGDSTVERFITSHTEEVAKKGASVPSAVAEVASGLLAGLEQARTGGPPDRPFYAWSTGAHWVIDSMKTSMGM